LLPRMIETGVIEMCEHVQIQFHEWFGFQVARIAHAVGFGNGCERPTHSPMITPSSGKVADKGHSQ
jgi:hypothetical protein